MEVILIFLIVGGEYPPPSPTTRAAPISRKNPSDDVEKAH